MKSRVKLATLLLAMVMLVAVTACNRSAPDKNEKKSSDETSFSTAPLRADSEVSEVVPQSALYEPDLDNLVTDAVYELVKDSYNGGWSEYHIPKINLPNDLAENVNREMLAEGEKTLPDSGLERYDYFWQYANRVVSVLVRKCYPNDCDYYKVYNVSVDTGMRLTNDDLRQMYGLTEQQLTDLLIQKAGQRFIEYYSSFPHTADYVDQYNKTITAENVAGSMLFINQSGDLCSVTCIYSMAGANTYWRLLNLTGTTPVEFPR
ncbi:MAG: hypothetical protein IKT68_06565 [Clostridia bacterium]|nr:hypothetical protein [Clostridia bacterium]